MEDDLRLSTHKKHFCQKCGDSMYVSRANLSGGVVSKTLQNSDVSVRTFATRGVTDLHAID
jgi:hypothetical protein